MNYFVINKNNQYNNFIVSRNNEIFQFRKNIDNFNINIVEGIRGIGKTSVINKFNEILKNERNKNTFYISVNYIKNFEDVKDEFDKNILCLLKEKQNSIVFLNSDNCFGLIDYIKKDILVKSHVFFETSSKYILSSQDIGKIYIYRINEFNKKEVKNYINTVSGMKFYEKYCDFYDVIENISCGIPKLLNKILSLISNYEIEPNEIENSDFLKNIIDIYMTENKEKFSLFSKELQLLSFNCFNVSFDYFFDNKKFINFLRLNLMIDESNKNKSLRKIFATYYRNSTLKKNKNEIYELILNKVFKNNIFDIECLNKMLLMSEICNKIEQFVDYTLNNIIPVDVYRNKLNLLSDIVCNILKKTDYRKFEVEKTRIILKSLMFYNKDVELENDIEKLKNDVEYYSIKGNYYMGINDFAKALNSFAKGIEKDNDILRQIVINYRMSNCYIALHDFNKAYENYAKTIEIIENLEKIADKNDKKSFFIINSIKGAIYRSKGFISLNKYRIYEAIDYFIRAEEKLVLLEDFFGLSTTYSMIALCYTRLDKFGLSLKYYRKHVVIEKKLASKNLKILRLNFIIDFYLILKKTEKANKFIRILESQLERGFLTYRYRIAMYDGLVSIFKNDFEKAVYYLEETLDILKDNSYHLSNLPLLFNYAKCLFLIKKTEHAAEVFKKVLDISEKNNMEMFRCLTMFFLGKIYTDTRHFYFEIYSDILKELPAEAKQFVIKEIEEFNNMEDYFQNMYPYNVSNIEGTKNCDNYDILKIRSNKSNYKFFIDFENLEMLIDGVEKNLFRKRNLIKTIIVLLEANGKTISPDEIFAKVWGRNISEKSDKNLLRVTIHSIRKIVPDYVVYDSINDGYSINGVDKYCIIRK